MSAPPARAGLVVKLGGEVISGPDLPALAADLSALRAAGREVHVVHGGGPQTSALQRRLGQEPHLVAGRRITDAAALSALIMVVGGTLNVELCGALLAAGARPVGLHGPSSRVIAARRRPPRVIPGASPEPIDLGLVGDVVGFDHELLRLLVGSGRIPVLACLGADEQGAVYNINADVVATRLAVELGAALVLVTDVPGVLRDVGDPGSRLAELSIAEGRRAIAAGTITRGMIPKLEESFAALEQGVAAIHIVGRLAPGDLRREMERPGSVGTVLRRV